MKRWSSLAVLVAALATSSSCPSADEPQRFRIMTLDPGHFHAALVQEHMYADVDPLVHVYAPPQGAAPFLTLPQGAENETALDSASEGAALGSENRGVANEEIPSDRALHLQRIESFNARPHDPTSWQTQIYVGSDFLERMVAETPGNIVVIAGDRPARTDEADWVVTIPERYHVGHEAHFAQVTERFLRYLRDGNIPHWEVPNMLTKYATIMQAYEMSRD